MTNSPLRQIAYSYCLLVSKLFKLLGFDGYQIGLSFALLAILCGIAFLAKWRGTAVVNRFCPPWLYCLLLIVSLFIARLPTFLPGSLNPDEAMFVAGAMKLRHYPVFWQSIDGATSGPLNYYPLTVLNLLGMPLDFATARVLNVVCIGGAIAVVYRIARLSMADWAARLTPLPPLAAAMAFRGLDFLHYSSECASVLLIAIGTWLLFAENLSNRADWARGVAIGVVAVLIPLAKLQASPIAATIVAGAFANALFWRRRDTWRRVFYVSLGLTAGIAGLLLFLVVFGIFGAFQHSYITANLVKANIFTPVSLETFLRYCLPTDLKWYEGGILTWLLYCIGSSYFRWRREGYPKTSNRFIQTMLAATLLSAAGAWQWNRSGGFTWSTALAFLLIGVGLAIGTLRTLNQHRSLVSLLSFRDLFVLSILCTSLYAIYRPRTNYPHYLAFLIFPLALVGVRTLVFSLQVSTTAGVPGSNFMTVRRAILFVCFTVALPFFLRSNELRAGHESETWMISDPASTQCAACQLVNRFAKPGDLVTVWGWEPYLYVLTGTLPASREPQTPYQISFGGPQLNYFRSRYLKDLELHPPKVFIDAVGPGQFAYGERDVYGFESIPELREYVTKNFYLAGDVDGVRVFARRGQTTR